MSTTGTVAVIGATGQQGGATVDALLQRGFAVRALTRHTGSDAARGLAQRGVEVLAADLADPQSVRHGFDGAAAAFAMTGFMGNGVEGEIAQGKVIGDAANAAGLPFLVFSSAGGAERQTGVPHLDSKGEIERYLSGLVPLNIMRAVFFMDNLIQLHMIGRDDEGWVVRLPVPGDVPLQMISVRDIGKVAAALIAQCDPEIPPIEIAAAQTTGHQLAELVAQRVGASARFMKLPLQALGDDDITKMFRWFVTDAPAFRADIARTRALVPDLEDLPVFLARQPSLG